MILNDIGGQKNNLNCELLKGTKKNYIKSCQIVRSLIVVVGVWKVNY